MKIKTLFFVGFILSIVLIFSGCSKSLVVTNYKSNDYNFDTLRNSYIQINISNSIKKLEFEGAFEKRYGKEEVFVEEMLDSLIYEFKLKFPLIKVVKGKFDDLKWFNTKDSLTTLKQDYFQKYRETYFLNISGINISHEFTYPTSQLGSTEICIVSYNAKLYNKNDSKLLLDLEVKGKDSVSLFMFQKALENAVTDSFVELVNYFYKNKNASNYLKK